MLPARVIWVLTQTVACPRKEKMTKASIVPEQESLFGPETESGRFGPSRVGKTVRKGG